MTKHYTELLGDKGAKIHFGPPARAADELFLSAAPIVKIGAQTFTLVTLSNLSFRLATDEETLRAAVADEAAMTATFVQGPETLLEQDVVIAQADQEEVECRFMEAAIDLDDLVKANARAVATQRIGDARIDHTDVPSEYKIFCADTLDLMSTLRRRVESQIAPFEEVLGAEDRTEIDHLMEERLAPDWGEFLARANSLVLPYKYDDDTRLRMKRYTENVVTGEMCRGALQKRCYEKPMGYPGDFQIMNAFYDNIPRGESTYDRMVDMLGLIAGRPVTKRMHHLTDELDRLTAGASGDRNHFHVMSVGAGPAREFRRYFEKGLGENVGFSITLVDPEVQALDCAIRNIYSSVRHGISSVMVSGMNASFTEMLRPKSTFRHLPQQDFIYSAGLTDYLNDKLTRSLILKLYDFVKPGGTVLVGNVNDDPRGMYWSAEYAVDWTMYFRNKEEMERIADGLPGDPELTCDASGSYFMLKLTKPA